MGYMCSLQMYGMRVSYTFARDRTSSYIVETSLLFLSQLTANMTALTLLFRAFPWTEYLDIHIARL
jgi:hypothetical protein